MKKLLLVLLLVTSCSSLAHRHRSKPTPPLQTDGRCGTYGTTTLCIPKCKDTNLRNQEFENFKNQFISQGYTVVRSMTSDTTFDILVRDANGVEHWEHKQWCSF